jgi:hypothetical protein
MTSQSWSDEESFSSWGSICLTLFSTLLVYFFETEFLSIIEFCIELIEIKEDLFEGEFFESDWIIFLVFCFEWKESWERGFFSW